MTRILFLAPQAFYQERGTPIAVDLALQALEAEGYDIDLLTYPGGKSRPYERIRHFRVLRVPGVNNVGPGFSWKKVLYSFLMIFSAFRLSFRYRYTLVHAVEEACFIACLLKLFRGLPYVYDMDSSIAQQLVEQRPFLEKLSGFFQRMEGLAIRHAAAVVAVCPALVDLAREDGAKKVLLLQDISLLDRYTAGENVDDLRQEMGTEAPLFLYVGNLEAYQGIDLLLDGFALAVNQGADAALAVVGGCPEDVIRYRQKAEGLGVARQCRFFGPRPVADLGAYLAQADVLVSPRSTGNNTPMKIYTYLDSGTALLATRIYSHTQVLDDDIACLVAPTPQGMAEGIVRLCSDADLRMRLGAGGHRRAVERHSFSYFQAHLTSFYGDVTAAIEEGAR